MWTFLIVVALVSAGGALHKGPLWGDTNHIYCEPRPAEKKGWNPFTHTEEGEYCPEEDKERST